MGMGLLARILYTSLVSPTFIASLAVTVIFELDSLEQTKISAQSNILFTILVILRIINYLFTIATLCMTITTYIPGTDSPVVPFGLANATLTFAIFSAFFVADFHFAANRYETETLTKFNITTKEGRDFTLDQLTFLNSFERMEKCCGLNGYRDYSMDVGNFTADHALSDDDEDPDTPKNGTKLTWRNFLQGTKVTFTVEDKCGMNETKHISIQKKILKQNEEVPKSCCKTRNNCEQRPFSQGVTTSIYEKGCNPLLLGAIKKVNTNRIRALLFSYPWVVSLYSMIVTWAFLCDVRGQPFKMFGILLRGKRKEAAPPAPTVFGKQENAADGDSQVSVEESVESTVENPSSEAPTQVPASRKTWVQGLAKAKEVADITPKNFTGMFKSKEYLSKVREARDKDKNMDAGTQEPDSSAETDKS